MRARRHAALVGLVAIMALTAAACGGAKKETLRSPTPTVSSTPTPTPTSGAGAVNIVDNAFQPPELTVAVGTKVVWTQTGSQPHTVTADDNSFDSSPNCPTNITSCLKTNETYPHTFTSAGRVPYYCKVHGKAVMSGVIIVQ